jgi:uncharacterized protein
MLFLGSITNISRAQDNTAISITGKGVVQEGEIILRWAPENYETWLNAKKYGYRVVRHWTGIGDEIFSAPKEIFSFEQPFVVTPESAWVMNNGKMDTLAFSALYDAEFLVYVSSPNSGTGGQLMKAYQLEEEKKNRFVYSLFAAEQNLSIATKLGLSLRDKEAKPNHQYTYYVYPILANGKSGEPAVIEVWNNEDFYRSNIPTLPKPEAKGEDLTALLSINIEGASKTFSYYDLYRKVENTSNFQKVNKNPILFANEEEIKGGGEFLAYADPLPDNDNTYEFMFVGRDAFGRSISSPTVKVKGVPGPLQAIIKITAIQEVNNAIKLSWEFPNTLNSKIKGFKVLSSENALGVFKPLQTTLLATNTRSFSTVPPRGAAYYRIVSVDLYDREIASVDVLGQLKDITPPAKPILLSCISNDEGKVLIKWKKNPDSDIKGYRVFLSSIKNEENYFQVTSDVVSDTLFEYVTTLNTLSEEAYFKIAAEDLHSNRSVNSDVCVMKRPDIIPPVAPLISKAEINSKGVDLAWVESSSSDVVSHQVERKELVATGQWKVLASFAKKGKLQAPAYIDTTANNMTTYLYRVAAIDDANLVSYSKSIRLKPSIKSNRTPIGKIVPYCKCDYIELKTNNVLPASLVPTINGTHPIVDIFHVKNPNSPWANTGNGLVDAFSPVPIPNGKNGDYSVILEWDYDIDLSEVEDFEIYRQMPKDTLALQYGYSYPFQMDAAYDPVLYSFAQDPLVVQYIRQQTKLNIAGKALLPIVAAKKNGGKHQFMDHLVPFEPFVNNGKQQSIPLYYRIVVRFKDGSASPTSAPIEIHFK